MNFLLYTKLAFTGAIILALELVASRILTPFFGVSLNVWSSILAVTLIALAIGYKFGGYLSNRLSYKDLLLYFIITGTLSALWMNLASYTYPELLQSLSRLDLVVGSIAACFYLLFAPLVLFSSLNSVLVALLNASIQKDKGEKDHKSGNVFFISTVGSVVGVFIAAYLLIPSFSNYTAYAILSTTASIITIILALSVKSISKTDKTFILGASIVMLLFSGNVLFSKNFYNYLKDSKNNITTSNWNIISKEPSFYGNHTIVDLTPLKGKSSRILLTSGLANNKVDTSGISLSVFTHALELLAISNTSEAKNALILGLGVGVIAKRFQEKGIQVDVVELDPVVAKIARQYFSFNDKNISLNIEDARTFIQKCPKKYDIIIIDLFKGDGIPSHIVSKEFFEDIKSCSSNNASIVMNAFYGTKDLSSKKALFKTIATVFKNIIVFEEPTPPSAEMTQGYILAKNKKEEWFFNISYDKTPTFIIPEIKAALENWTEYTPESAFLINTIPIYDNLNDWKRLTVNVDMAHRKNLIQKIPLNVLLD